MYLQPGKAARVLEGLADRFGEDGGPNNSYFASASFVFADRLFRYSSNSNATAANISHIASENSVQDATATKDTADQTATGVVDFFSGTEESELCRWLRDRGWKLQEFLSKPGATRHLGIATTT